MIIKDELLADGAMPNMFSAAMTLLGLTFRILHLLTRLGGVNVFSFARGRQHAFRTNKLLLLLVRCMHYFGVMPVLVVVLAADSYWMGKCLWNIMVTGVQGEESATSLLSLLSTVYYFRQNFFIAYIVYTFNCRLDKLMQLLNDFASAYKQCVSLFGPQLRLQWIACAIFCGKVLLAEAAVYPLFLGSSYRTLFLLMIYSVQPMLLSVTSLLGLMLLHGLFRTATLHGHQYHPLWQRPLTQKQTAKLIQFYCKLLSLRRDFEPYLKVFSTFEIVSGFIWIFLTLIINLVNRTAEFHLTLVFIMPLTCPAVVSHYTHDIGVIAERLGDELLTVHCEYVAGASSKMIQLFCLHKLLMETVQDSSGKVLYIRKNFILIFLETIWVNVMFILSVLATAREKVL